MTEDEVDASTGAPFQSVVGEEAHIYSATPDGPRYDPTYPLAKLETYENRILLCAVHHTRVDTEGGRGYNAETLLAMKKRHEQQEERRERITVAIRAYIADQHVADDKVLFQQAKLDGPSVDTMFVDVPFACRADTAAAPLLSRISVEHPGDMPPPDGFVVTGAAQALLHPDWTGNALLVGGPGQGKSTLLQYLCQFHRARQLNIKHYSGEAQGLKPLTEVTRVPIRLDLRNYALWASTAAVNRTKSKRRPKQTADQGWPTLEQFIAVQVGMHSGGHQFTVEDVSTLVATEAVLLALDGLDEVANLDHRDRVSEQIVRAGARLQADAHNLVVIVATRPGTTTSPLWSSANFPLFHLQRLTAGLRLQYLHRWTTWAELSGEAAGKLRRTFLEHENLPHIRDLASYPMQLAILLHLLQRRGLLPQQRTELYSEYLQTFLDREETEHKEPLLSSQRDVIVDLHAFLGWHLQTQAEIGDSSGQIARADLRRLLDQHLEGREKGRELAKQLFSAINSRVLCLIERDPGYFQFEVQSLREYFAAAYIHEYADPRGSGNSRADCFDALLARPYWLNVCRFFVGLFTKIEVRGIRHSLRELSAKPPLARHPHLRLTAGRLLDDRAYQGQPDTPIQEIVDFVLEGQGVMFADDGFLDESGQPLTFAEDAGRSQVVHHLKPRLKDPALTDGARRAIVRTLRRHFTCTDDPARWWWNEFQPTASWLQVAAELGILAVMSPPTDRLREAVVIADTDTHWASEILAEGDYGGSGDDVLQLCLDEINDGAADVLHPTPSTPLGKLVTAAAVAQLRPSAAEAHDGQRTTRTRARRPQGRSLVADLAAATEPLRTRPEPGTDTTGWSTRILQVWRLWGDGWVVRQAVALTPAVTELGAVATSVDDQEPALATVVRREANLRARRGDLNWWRQDREAADTDLCRRAWLFSVLTAAHPAVLFDLAADIDATVTALTPKHYRSLEAAVTVFARTGLKRQLSLREPLRLGHVTFSARTLWLLRPLATENSADQIAKKLIPGFQDLLAPGFGDQRPVLRAIGVSKTIPIDTLRGTRESLPAGAWASHVKLGAMKTATATDILTNPDLWPVEIVGRAIQHTAGEMNRMPAIASLAQSNRWFYNPQ